MPYWYFPDDDDDDNNNDNVRRDPFGRPAIGPRGRSERLPHHQPGAEVNIPIHLSVNDNPRIRASSTGARPQPNLIPSDIDKGFVREVADQRAKLDLLEEENQRLQRQVYYEKAYNARRREAQQSSGLDADLINRLAGLNVLGNNDPSRYPGAYDSSWRHRLEDDRLREEERRKQLQAQFEADQRRAEKEEQEIIDRAELKRRDKEATAKLERARLIAEEKARIEQEKQDQKAQREKILFEEEQRRAKEKEEKEQTRLRVLAEEKERVREEKEKADKEEEEFHAKVRERFVKAGYSPDYIEAILNEKRKKSSSALLPYRRASDLALDMDRPTYIRVQEKHLLPETLDAYGLPWEYDPHDRKYIFIKRYITHEAQQELFNHSAEIIRRRRTKYMLTDGSDGYTKETISTTTLRPGLERVKSKDGMYLVRSRSTSKSKSPRRSWLF